MFTRWLTASLVAIGLGVAALELSTCLAAPRGLAVTPSARPFTDGVERELPIGAEIDPNEASALPSFTQ
jgi:hypothetical protein